MGVSVQVLVTLSNCILCLSVAATAGKNDTNSTLTLEANRTKDRVVVNKIPELPASVAKPGIFDQGIWLVLFYTPWCEYSHEALPHFVATVQHIVDNNMTGVSIGKLDVSKESGLGRYFNIRRTPVIAMYRDGYRHDYVGEVSTEELISFAVLIIRANATLIESREQLESLQHNHPVLFLLVHDTKVDTDWQQVYRKVSAELALRGTFLYTVLPSILHSPPSKLPALLVLKDGQQHHYTGALAGHFMYKWVLRERFTAFPTATISSLKQYLVTLDIRKLLILAVDSDVSQRRIVQKKALEIIKKLALSRKFHQSFQFVLTEGPEVAERLLRQTVDGFPQLFVFDHRTGYYHIYRPKEKGYAESAIVEFLELAQASKLPYEGGTTYRDRVLHLYNLLSALVQATLTHHPYVGAAAGFSMMSVLVFYIVLCCQKYTKRKLPRPSRARARQAALARRHDSTATTMRHRHHGDHNNAQEHSDEESEDERSKDK